MVHTYVAATIIVYCLQQATDNKVLICSNIYENYLLAFVFYSTNFRKTFAFGIYYFAKEHSQRTYLHTLTNEQIQEKTFLILSMNALFFSDYNSKHWELTGKFVILIKKFQMYF